MKTYLTTLLSLLLLATSCKNSTNFEVTHQLNDTEVRQFKSSIIRYVAHLPKKATDYTKHEAKFDLHYSTQVEAYRLDKYYPTQNGDIYFEISRNAPSFKVKRVATAGRLRQNSKGEITDYEEIYRTWKMEEDELELKTNELFTKLITQQDLSNYYPQNTREEYIEFPSETIRYNKQKRKWELTQTSLLTL